jgi:hypothetical protein
LADSRKITLTADNEEIELYIIEQTMIGNVNYILASEAEEGDSDAYILKQTGSETDEAVYEFVEDEEELTSISRIFEQLLDDVEFS